MKHRGPLSSWVARPAVIDAITFAETWSSMIDWTLMWCIIEELYIPNSIVHGHKGSNRYTCCIDHYHPTPLAQASPNFERSRGIPAILAASRIPFSRDSQLHCPWGNEVTWESRDICWICSSITFKSQMALDRKHQPYSRTCHVNTLICIHIYVTPDVSIIVFMGHAMWVAISKIDLWIHSKIFQVCMGACWDSPKATIFSLQRRWANRGSDHGVWWSIKKLVRKHWVSWFSSQFSEIHTIWWKAKNEPKKSWKNNVILTLFLRNLNAIWT